MTLNENLFMGDGIKKPDKYVHKLSTGKFIKKFYVVVLSDNINTLEIYPSYNFLQKYYRDKNFEIVAITKEEASAFEYIRKLSEISVRKYNDFDARKTIYSLRNEDIEYLNKVDEEEEDK